MNERVDTIITNSKFLEIWRAEGPTGALLVHEATLVTRRLAVIVSDFEEVIRQKQQVSGGDDWHDGAFRATDSVAGNLVEKRQELAELLTLPMVSLPEPESNWVSIGSRVLLAYDDKEPFNIDIVGTSLVYPKDGPDFATILSPLAQQIVGHGVGDTVTAMLGDRKRAIEIHASEPMEIDVDRRG